MSSIIEYLDQIKKQNPDFKRDSYLSMYQKLKDEDASMPSWEQADNSRLKKGQTNYERKQSPDLANQLLDWTDWSIDENSAKWAQNAYNQSIGGMAYQLYNGEQRFDLDNYNPGIGADIGSAVLSFMMPLDFLTMFAGGAIGKGFTGLAGYGMKTAATNNLVKLSGKKLTQKALSKETSKQLAKRTAAAQRQVDLIIGKGGGHGALFSAYAPKASASIMQGATLATFEGARGGIQAAIDDTDIWEGVMDGVAHGGFMGGLAGAAGAGLNIKHAKLIAASKNKIQTRAENTLHRIAEKGKLAGTGIPGQLVTEASIFTAPELENLINDEDYTVRDLLRSYTTNIGMMGVLKAKSKLWDKATKPLKEHYEEIRRELEAEQTLKKSKDEIETNLNKQIENAETPEQREILERQKAEVQKLTEVELKELDVKGKEYENWEPNLKRARELIEKGSDLSKVKTEEIHNVVEQVHGIYGAINKNINKFKQENPVMSKASKEKLTEMEAFKKQWESEILEPLNNIENLKKQSKTFTTNEISKARKDFKDSWKDANKKGDESAKKELRKGIEDKISEKGEIADNINTADLMEKSKAYETSLKEKGQLGLFEKPAKPTKKVVKTKEEKKVESLQQSIDSVKRDIKNTKLQAQKEGISEHSISFSALINPLKSSLKGLSFQLSAAKKALAPKPITVKQKIKAGEGQAKSENFMNLSKVIKNKNPKALKNIQKNLGKLKGEYTLTKVQERLIDIVNKKKKVDSKPAVGGKETLNILKSIETKPSKNIIKEGIKRFGTQKKLIEIIDKYRTGKISKSEEARLKPWLAKNTNYLKNYFNIKTKGDALLITNKANVNSKSPIDYLDLAAQFRVKSFTNDSKQGKETFKSTHKRITQIENEIKSRKDIPYNEFQLQDILEHTTGKYKIEAKGENKLTVSDLLAYESRLNSILNKKQVKNEGLVEKAETDYNINPRQRNNYFNEVHKTTLEKATKEQIDMYEAYIKKGKKVTPKNEIMIDGMIDVTQNKNNGGIATWKRAFMTSTDVLISAGNKIKGVPGKALKNIARAITGHDFTYHRFKGEGGAAVYKVKRAINNKHILNNYMHFMDSKTSSNAISQVKRLIKKEKQKELKAKGEGKSYKRNKYYEKELKEMEQVKKDFGKGGKYHEAKDVWKEYTDYMWSQMTVEISKHTRTNREFKKIIDGLNQQYIKQYFSRRPKKEVLEYLQESSPVIESLANKHVKDLTLKDLRKIAEAENVSLKDLNSKTIKDAVARQIFDMFSFGPIKMNPGFLKTRGVQLPEYMEITTRDGQKKFIKTYETTVEGTMNQYVEGMAKFLATVRHFPEFTKISSKFAAKGSKNIETLEKIKGSKDMGSYAYNLIKTQLGLDYSSKDVLVSPYLKWAGKATNISAMAGLSTPLAGIKNVIIQMPRSVALFGIRNTTRGIAAAMKVMPRNYSKKSEKAYIEAIKRGETGYGTKELIRNEGKFTEIWFKNVNLMTRTENFNRIVLAEAGRLHFTELLNVAKGNKTMFHPNGKASEVKRMFKETWKLTEKEIDFLTNTKGVENTRKFQEILSRVGHESHKAGAGSTGAGDLPLWFSNKYARPLTLFQRMATSVTIDSYKNYIKPLKNGNPMPLIKATIGHGLGGWALYSMYDWGLGQQAPTEDSPGIDRAMGYLWRGEMLGVFGEVLSPYDISAVPISEPVVLRNIKHAGDEVWNVFTKGKSVNEAIVEFGKRTFVGASQAEKLWNKIKHPYVSDSKRIKILTGQFNSQMEYKNSHSGQITQRQPYYWKLKEAIMFGKSDDEIARNYYAAFDFICHELENIENISSKAERMKRADIAINAVIRNMNPISLSDNNKSRANSKRTEFLNWLSKSNAQLALSLEKQYKYKVRIFEGIKSRGKYRDRYSIYPNN